MSERNLSMDTSQLNYVRSCEGCLSTDLVEDRASGDTVCVNCGIVYSEKYIAPENSGNGSSYNSFNYYSLTQKSKLEREELEFIWDGEKNIEESLYHLFQGEHNAIVEQRAKELFQRSFKIQLEQKEGLKPMNSKQITKSPEMFDVKDKKRQRFSRRKQFVVSCVWFALTEQGITTWSIQDLSEIINGMDVSAHSVNNCLRDLEVI